ncbi:STN domain-containing protein, partial [Sphingobacterium siyangense]|uniref:STN domain-containing protein n=1 Tax=Sphingobacterium siyangense TaxID=459529 RepID=UPI002FDD9D1C
MKILALLLLVTIAQLKADIKAQVVNLSLRKTNLKQVFFEMKKQSGFDFFYITSDIEGKGIFDVNLKNIPLEEALKKVLHDKDLSYEISNRSIIIKSKVTILSRPNMDNRQEPIRGQVVDSLGKPLVSVSISVKGKIGGATNTDSNG